MVIYSSSKILNFFKKTIDFYKNKGYNEYIINVLVP